MIKIPVTVRRTVVQTEPGQTATIDIGMALPMRYERALVDFANKRHCPIRVISNERGLITFERLPTGTPTFDERISYDPIDALQVGESCLFEIPPALYSRVRVATGRRNAMGDVRLSCSSEAAGIRVTRHELGKKPRRATRWGLERLETEKQITVTVADFSQRKALSAAVYAMSRCHFWKLTTRALDDNTVLVIRLDDPVAPNTSPAPPITD